MNKKSLLHSEVLFISLCAHLIAIGICTLIWPLDIVFYIYGVYQIIIQILMIPKMLNDIKRERVRNNLCAGLAEIASDVSHIFKVQADKPDNNKSGDSK